MDLIEKYLCEAVKPKMKKIDDSHYEGEYKGFKLVVFGNFKGSSGLVRKNITSWQTEIYKDGKKIFNDDGDGSKRDAIETMVKYIDVYLPKIQSRMK